MPLSLTKRVPNGAELTAVQHDANMTAIEGAVNAKADSSGLATVATTGAYADLSGTPTLGTAADNDEGDFATPAQATYAALCIACSDETTDLVADTAVVTFRMPFAMTVSEVRANVNTAPVGSTLIVDINEGGVSILGTKLSIDAGEETSETAAAAATITDAALADDAEITIDIDQVGATTAGTGLKVWLIGVRA